MLHKKVYFFLILPVFLASLLFIEGRPASAFAAEQTEQPTAVPGIMMITISPGDEDHVNVRAGPGMEYNLLGALLAGQQVPALGRSAGGDWVEISYPPSPNGLAWVYAWLVTVNGSLPVIEIPPTPTPKITPTIDQTLAAQFIISIPPTRKPTFTSPPPITYPTFAPETVQKPSTGPVLVYLMLGVTGVGLLGVLLSFIRIR